MKNKLREGSKIVRSQHKTNSWSLWLYWLLRLWVVQSEAPKHSLVVLVAAPEVWRKFSAIGKNKQLKMKISFPNWVSNELKREENSSTSQKRRANIERS